MSEKKKSKLMVVTQETPPPTPKDEKGDQKTVVVNPKVMNAMGRKLGKIKVVLVGNVVSTAVASAAQNPVDTLNANGALEYSSYAALYDEFKVNSIDCYLHVSCTASSNTPIEFGFVYDPANSGAYSAAEQSLATSQHIYGVLGSLTTNSIQCVTKNGFVVKKLKVPRGPLSSAAVAGNNWCPTSASTSNTICGYGKFYVDSTAAGNSVLMRTYVYHCEFRSRS
jgi:hypothetical protein